MIIQKLSNTIKIEKKRKDVINLWIENLGKIVPGVDLAKDSKHLKLEKTYNYIKELQVKNQNLILSNTPETQGIYLCSNHDYLLIMLFFFNFKSKRDQKSLSTN